jgi:chaperone protein EcpD
MSVALGRAKRAHTCFVLLIYLLYFPFRQIAMRIKQSFKSILAAACVALGLAGAIHAHASVVIAATRVVYNAKSPEETLKLSNEGKSPALVQAWIDSGDSKATPSSVDVPFVVTPPISRIDPTRAQTLRVVYTGEALPQDRESVFWLNVLEVPPKPDADEAATNKLQLAFRSRIKLFFRPAGLQGMAEEAPARITWRLGQAGNQSAIEARNPTPYHVSFTGVDVSAGGKTATFDDGGMVAPGETKVFPLNGEVNATADAKVSYHALNDFGGPIDGDAKLTQGSAESAK